MDYDDEARKLFATLGLDASGAGNSRSYNPMDPIYRDTSTGGTVFVGNNTAAQNLAELQRSGVTHVVNCTDNLPLYHEGQLTYLRFNISFWPAERDLAAFLATLFDFVDDAISKGGSVLVHCLAGAHRAGTSGCLLLMKYGRLNRTDAVLTAKKLRSAIDPIGRFPQLLQNAEGILASRREAAGEAALPTPAPAPAAPATRTLTSLRDTLGGR